MAPKRFLSKEKQGGLEQSLSYPITIPDTSIGWVFGRYVRVFPLLAPRDKGYWPLTPSTDNRALPLKSGGATFIGEPLVKGFVYCQASLRLLQDARASLEPGHKPQLNPLLKSGGIFHKPLGGCIKAPCSWQPRSKHRALQPLPR